MKVSGTGIWRQGKRWLLNRRAVCRSLFVLGWAGLDVWPSLSGSFNESEGTCFCPGLHSLSGLTIARSVHWQGMEQSPIHQGERVTKVQLTWHLFKWFLANKVVSNGVFVSMSKIIYKMSQSINGLMIVGQRCRRRRRGCYWWLGGQPLRLSGAPRAAALIEKAGRRTP